MTGDRKYNFQQGGSIASSQYDKIPSQAQSDLPYPDGKSTLINGDDIVKNYGSVYTTTGGGNLNEKAYQFISKFINNRVLDLYLKYLGITMLTPTTLVPIALIYGQKTFMEAVNHMKSQEQVGGTIPVIDNALVGNYLKIAGLTQLSLSLNTIVPLGLAMAIYQSVVNSRSQKGGHIAKLITGTNSPAGYLELAHMNWDGQSVANNIYRPLTGWEQLSRKNVYRNHELQVPCVGNACGVDPATSNPPLDKLYVDVAGLGPNMGSSSGEEQTPVLAVRPVEIPDASSTVFSSTSGDASIDISADPNYSAVLPNQMAGATGQRRQVDGRWVDDEPSWGQKTHRLELLNQWANYAEGEQVSKNRKDYLEYFSTKIQSCGPPNDSNLTEWMPQVEVVLQERGIGHEGGSDWKSTHYSRGSYTAPDMAQSQFQQFSETGDYISNRQLANSAADAFQPASALRAGKVGPPTNYPEFGVPTHNFSAGGRHRSTRQRRSSGKRQSTRR